MGWTYNGSHRLCATCAYWTGAREITSGSTSVTNCEGTGKCAIPNGPLRNFERLGNTCACQDWKKWPVLR